MRLTHPENQTALLLGLDVLQHRPAPADFLRFRPVRVILDANGLGTGFHNQPAAAFEFGTSAMRFTYLEVRLGEQRGQSSSAYRMQRQ